jgi:hypothetical protein
MTWEQTPDPPAVRWRLWTVAILAAITVVGAILLTRGDGSGMLTIGPTAPPTSADLVVPSSNPADVRPTPLGRMEATTEIPGDGPMLPDAPDLTLVTGDDGGLRTIDLATGDVRFLGPMAGVPYVLDPWMMFAVGDHVISSANDSVVGMTGPDWQTTQLARNHYALQTFDDTSVWVHGNPFGDVGTSGLLRLRLDGTIADRTVVPSVAQPKAGIADGVLLSTPSGIHLASGDGVRRITASGELVAVSADRRLAWLDCAADLSCFIVIGTLDDPDQVRMPIASTETTSGDIGLPLGRFSPDGRQLALPLLRFGVDPMNMTRVQGAVVIVDTVTGSEVTRVQAALSEAFQGSPFEWSPDGRFLFVGLGFTLLAWDRDTGELTELENRPSPIRGLAVTRGW